MSPDQTQLIPCIGCGRLLRVGVAYCGICGAKQTPLPQEFYAADTVKVNLSSPLKEAEKPQSQSTTKEPENPQPQSTLPVHEFDEISQQLKELIAEMGNIERYFPGDVTDKKRKIAEWKVQLQRASECATLLQHPQLRLMDEKREHATLSHLAEAVRILDFRREYTVTIVGHRGAGKSTLLGAMLGQDLFPRGQGGAVTGVRTRVLLCNPDDPEDQ